MPTATLVQVQPVTGPADRSCRGCVVSLTADHQRFDSQHEQDTRAEVARRLAGLKGFDYGGEHDRALPYAKPMYFVPSDTLAGAYATGTLGLRDVHDLFGGVVPHAFVATKVITHSLVDVGAARPEGWAPRLGECLSPVVLPGFSAFAHDDARRAGRLLLKNGAVRIKPTCATGGRSQVVVEDADALDRCLDATSAEDLARHGIVLEENLRAPMTYSVGQVIIDSTVASYHGVQRETRDNHGETAYGGSDLHFVRGGFEVLLAQTLPPHMRLAIEQAQAYHQAVSDCFPGFFASRINYDVAQGAGPKGEPRSGVLEQSWRLGGATGAEIAALETFRDRPACTRVHASCFEAYGAEDPPPGATVYFRGVDAQVGLLLKYTVIHPDIHTDSDPHADPR
jgi:hypothetical protein